MKKLHSSEEGKDATKEINGLLVKASKKLFKNRMPDWNLTNIPDFGPAVQATMTSLEGPILKKRMNCLISSIREEVQHVDRKTIDFTYFQTEEFYDIVRRVLENTVRTRNEVKIRLYARILVRLPILNNASFRPAAEDFLLILLELSPADLSLAREVFRQQRDTPEGFTKIEEQELKVVKESGWDSLPRITRMNESNFTLSVVKLVRAGLLRQVIGTYVSYIGDAYRITPVFRTLMKLIDKLD